MFSKWPQPTKEPGYQDHGTVHIHMSSWLVPPAKILPLEVRAKHTPLGLMASQSGSPPNRVTTEPSLTLRILGSVHKSPSIILSPPGVKTRSDGVTSQVSSGFCSAFRPSDTRHRRIVSSSEPEA